MPILTDLVEIKNSSPSFWKLLDEICPGEWKKSKVVDNRNVTRFRKGRK